MYTVPPQKKKKKTEANSIDVGGKRYNSYSKGLLLQNLGFI